MKNLFVLFVFFLISQLSYAQITKIDSVLQLLQKNPNDTNRVNNYNYLANQYLASDVQKATEYLNQSISLSKKLNYQHGEGIAIYRLGLIAWRQNNYQTADSLYKIAFNIFEKHKLQAEISDCLGSFGSIELNKGNYVEALNWYLKSMKIAESLRDNARLAVLYNNLGLVYKNQNNFDEALTFYQKSLLINEKTQNILVTTNLNNIGLIYYERKDFEKALFYYQKALEINEKRNNQRSIALNTNNIANVYLAQKNAMQALPYIRKSIAINQQLNQKNPLNYSSLGKAYNLLGKPDSSLLYFHQAIKISRAANTKTLTQGIYRDLAENHKQNRQWDSALFYKELQVNLKDSLLSEESLRKISSLQTTYEVAKKQAQIALLKKDNEISKLLLNKQAILAQQNATQLSLLTKENEIKEIDLKQQKILVENQRINEKVNKSEIALLTKNQELYEIENENQALIRNISYLVSFFILILLAGLTFGYYQKEKANRLLITQKEEIQSQAYDLQTAHNLINIKSQNITASIAYAQRIQQAMLPLQEKFNELFGKNNSFILFKPKDVVSGDFYWLHELDNGQIILGVADCTGHGVPGAFMSMIGNQLLFDIVEKQEIYDVEKILEILHKDIQRTLKQKTTNNHDGMDIALCLIDKIAKKIEYAGAMNPIYYIQNHQLVEVKADRSVIGGSQQEKTHSFTKHIISILPNTSLYLFTDGYKDQFGGKEKGKFMSKRLKSLILENHEQEMESQQEILNSTIENWIKDGQRSQIDDILVIGVRL
jgi:serine phosphatase RsbU (regulator of sigma subunit)/tetratricopeptide (TPR) repeat protein